MIDDKKFALKLARKIGALPSCVGTDDPELIAIEAELRTIQRKLFEKSKSDACKIVLHLMDEDCSYERAVELALWKYPNVKKTQLEKELATFI